MEINEISGLVVDSALSVHSELGPGLLESTYEACLIYELRSRELLVHRQLVLPVHYKGINSDAGYRIDLLVEQKVIVELKVVAELLPLHKAQLLTYLKLSNKKVGLLISFNSQRLKNGIKQLVY